MGTTRVDVRIPDDLLEKVDVVGEVTHKNRMEIVTEALRAYLDGIEDEAAFKEALVECYLDDEIVFDALKAFVGRQDAESVRASKTVLDRGGDIAADLAER